MTVSPGATLNIEPGVTLRLGPGASILVNGTLNVFGTESEPVLFEASTTEDWGSISFVDTVTTSTLSHVIIRDATVNRQDPKNLKAAISGYNAFLVLDHIDIVGPQPIFARYGSTILLDSRIHITFTGDGINVKQGSALVDGCTFTGEPTVDTDAIDYDGVVDGQISDNRIYAFLGDNSDGIDVGEGCINLLVTGNRIYNNYDKGISVGQGSEVIIEQNLIVGCAIGVGIKDNGSTASIDQNTLARNDVGVAVYEKNLGAGGGNADISNTIFSRNKDADVTIDALSTGSIRYSLSDTTALPGVNNVLDDPLFTSPGIYDFSLQSSSPAIDGGDPSHALDPDNTRADIGMAYAYDPIDYPYLPPNAIIINEVMAHSHDILPDWIELYNSGSEPIDIGGWYLSDNDLDLQKYRIEDGTTIPAYSYIVFYEDTHFGLSSSDPGALTPFALSENGDTIHLFEPATGIDLQYHVSESFGASQRGVSIGRYYKESSRTYNFVAMAEPTPGAVNSLPMVGPVVISEIMYHPDLNADSEYFELLNISSEAVALVDTETGEGWAITNGIDYSFPTGSPVTMQPGERIILTRNSAAFAANFSVAEGTQVLQWTQGGLSNGGETLELSIPGDVDANMIRQFIRIDRVNYDDTSPWPGDADGSGACLSRIDLQGYGNDFANWSSAMPSPGNIENLVSFSNWAQIEALPIGQDDLSDDPDGDGLVNLIEYALGTSPTVANPPPTTTMQISGGVTEVAYSIASGRSDLDYTVQKTNDLASGIWETVSDVSLEAQGETTIIHAIVPTSGSHYFFKLVVSK